MNTNNQQLTTQQQRSLALKQKHSTVKNLLETYKDAIQNALPKFLTPEKMIRVALTAMSRNPDLLDCTQHSLIGCVLTSAQLGLMPDEVLGEAYLIPFNNTRKGVKECTFIVGYRGLCQLAMRSGMVRSVSARAVFAANETDGDKFEYELGLHEKLVHIPSGLKDASRITHFYAIVRFNNGGHVMHVMTRKEIEGIRAEIPNWKFSKRKEDTIWHKYFEEMGCKTALRRLMKYVPLSSDINQVIGMDEQFESGQSQQQGNQMMFFGDAEIQDAVVTEITTEQDAQQKEQNESKAAATADKATAAIQQTLTAMGADAPKFSG